VPKSPEEMLASMISNLAEKTGRSLQEWLTITSAAGLEKHGQIVKLLKSEHSMTHGYANLVATMTLRGDAPAPEGDSLVEAQYAGPKAALKPAYNRVIEAVGKFGNDIEIAPKKAYVSLRRNKQFALIQPSTKTRVDIGINLKDREPAGRLEASGSFNAMVSHRVRVAGTDEVDEELLAWLRAAYDAA
jgi:hypothetical protein